ncbi:hypothetical protein Taro_022427 [Colocasia esculenta]|uniref:Uncharacterized protein n=1 Tax=Colocasia esculenta TaxID=4460 RepID=A0A843V8C3_COLES|nr:hypothetical protein [Colocasia esculenta]
MKVCRHTSHGVDTRPQVPRQKIDKFAKVCRHKPDCVSTRVGQSKNQIRSTLDPVPRIASLKNWDRRSTHSQSRSTQDTFPEAQAVNFQTSTSLKHSKEADPVEDFFGEEFEEDPTCQIAKHRLGLQASQHPTGLTALQTSTSASADDSVHPYEWTTAWTTRESWNCRNCPSPKKKKLRCSDYLRDAGKERTWKRLLPTATTAGAARSLSPR